MSERRETSSKSNVLRAQDCDRTLASVAQTTPAIAALAVLRRTPERFERQGQPSCQCPASDGRPAVNARELPSMNVPSVPRPWT